MKVPTFGTYLVKSCPPSLHFLHLFRPRTVSNESHGSPTQPPLQAATPGELLHEIRFRHAQGGPWLRTGRTMMLARPPPHPHPPLALASLHIASPAQSSEPFNVPSFLKPLGLLWLLRRTGCRTVSKEGRRTRCRSGAVRVHPQRPPPAPPSQGGAAARPPPSMRLRVLDAVGA